MTSKQNAETMLDLLGEWQSLYALLPDHLKQTTAGLNRRTLDVLEAKYDAICPGCGTNWGSRFYDAERCCPRSHRGYDMQQADGPVETHRMQQARLMAEEYERLRGPQIDGEYSL